MEESNAIVPIEHFTSIQSMGEVFSASGMFGCKNKQQGTVLALTCIMEKRTPIQLMRKYHLVDGTPSMRADAMLADFNARGGEHRIISRTPDVAEIELIKGENKQTFKLTFEEACLEPFVRTSDGKKLKTNWATPRARQQSLWARVCSDGVRAMDPGVVAGSYTPEEIEDMAEGSVPKAHAVVTDMPPPVVTDTTSKKPSRAKPEAPAPSPAPIDNPPAAEPPPTTVEPTEVLPPTEPDYNLMPIGNPDFRGKPFSNISTPHLKSILKRIEGKKNPELTEGHGAVIRNILAERGES